MPGKPHGWSHDRAKHIRKKNPDLPEGAEYGIAQLQEVAVGKEKEHGGKVKSYTKTKAKKKHKKSPSSYESKAAPKSKKSKSKKSTKRKAAMKDLIKMMVEASNHFDSVGEVALADTLDKIGTRLLTRFASKDDADHLKLREHTCGCDEGPKDSNDNGICDECGLVYSEECGCGETDLTGYCLGCSSTQPLMRVMVTPEEDMVIAYFDGDGKLLKTSGGPVSKAVGGGVGGGLGYVAGKTLGGIAGTVAGSMIGMPGVGAAVGSGLGGAAGAAIGGGAGSSLASTDREVLVKCASELVIKANALDTLDRKEQAVHLDAILERLAELEAEDRSGGCCDSPRDRNANGICDCCGDVSLDGCECGSHNMVGRCNKCGAGNMLSRVSKGKLFKTGDAPEGTTTALLLPANSPMIRNASLNKDAGAIGSAIGGAGGALAGAVSPIPFGAAIGGAVGSAAGKLL